MNASTITALSALALSTAGAARAAIDVHVIGDDWSVWVTGPFSVAPAQGDPDANRYDFASDGPGVAMEFMMQLSDGTIIEGTDLASRAVSATLVGGVGDAQLALAHWSFEASTTHGSFYAVWDALGDPVALDNLGSSGKDCVRYSAGGFDETISWTLERPDGSVETFSTSFQAFDLVAPVPAPSAAVVFGAAALAARRRSRG